MVAKRDQEELGLVGSSPPTKAIPVAEATKFSYNARKGDEEGDVSKRTREMSAWGVQISNALLMKRSNP